MLCTANSPRPTLIPEHTHKLLEAASSGLGSSQPSLPRPSSDCCSPVQSVHLIFLGWSQAGGSRVQRCRLGEVFSERHCKGFHPKPVAVFHALGCSSFRHRFWSWGKMHLPAQHHLPPSSSFLLIQHSHPCHKSTSTRQGEVTQCQREGSCPGKATIRYQRPYFQLGTLSMKHGEIPGILPAQTALPGHFHLVRLQRNDRNLARSDP